MEWFDDDDEAVEEFEELYSITTKIDEEDLSDLENDILEEDHTELKPAEAICRGEVAQMVWNLLKAAGEV